MKALELLAVLLIALGVAMLGWFDSPDEPGPAPIPGNGLRVAIIYESADLSRLPKAQLAILSSAQVRDWLSAHCAKGADGKTPDWVICDQNVDMTYAADTWKQVLARPRKSLPWIVISTGRKGFEGPLPADVPATMELLKKYGGANEARLLRFPHLEEYRWAS